MKNTKIYAEYLEGKAMSQFYDAMKQPFVVKGALMPDAHAGYTLPIGAAVATDNFVLPAWVGYDIGCGMSATKLANITKDDIIDSQDAIFDALYSSIPVGFDSHSSMRKWDCTSPHTEVVAELIKKGAFRQLGTLGGGNHFIEIGEDTEANIWIVIHSGSRGFGHKIATHYMKLAGGGKAREGHFGFTADSQEGKDYMLDATFAQEFALENREQMTEAVYKAICSITGVKATQTTFINRNHNHVVQRDIDGVNCYIHRKGATHAEYGMYGVIPGNMRDGSFIVKGKGNPDALYSSSHGAGRVLGRRAAKESLVLADFEKQMVGIKAKVGQSTLDESPDAYKNIFDVMDQQSELVEVVTHVKPLLNIKG